MSITFKSVADEVIVRAAEKSSATIRQYRLLLKCLAPLHGQPVQDVETPALWQALRAVEDRGARQVAHRCLRFAGLVLRYAIANGWRTAPDCSTALSRLLLTQRPVPRAAVTTEEGLRLAMQKIRAFEGDTVRTALLRIAPHVFLRPNELLEARWDEFDLEAKTWVIPAARMKMRREHVVPLSAPVIAILSTVELESTVWVFPGRRRRAPLCKGTLWRTQIEAGLEPSVCTPHGWRSTASTLLGEQGFDRDLIELQLAHRRRGVEGIYNRAERLDARRVMMESWSAYLERLV